MSKTSNKLSLAEVFIQFQIQVKKKEIQDYQQEMCQLEDKKQRLIKLQEKLKEEQSGHVCELRKKMKEQERNLEQKEMWSKEQVEHGVQENLELKHKQEKELEELHCKLARLQVQVDELQAEKQVWIQYKNKGITENQERIRKLETDIAVSHSTFQDLSDYFQRSLSLAVKDIDRKTAQRSDEIIQLSEKRAKENLDTDSKNELEESDWLRREVDVYCREISVLESAVQTLEMENLELVNKLFDQPSDNTPIREEFCAQTAHLGSHHMHGMSETIIQLTTETSPVELVGRPPCPRQPLEEAEGARQKPPARWGHDLSETLYRSEINVTEPIHLDSLKQKLLCVVGEASTLHQPPSEPMDGSEMMTYGPKESVVTTRAIQNKLQQFHISTLKSGGSNES